MAVTKVFKSWALLRILLISRYTYHLQYRHWKWWRNVMQAVPLAVQLLFEWLQDKSCHSSELSHQGPVTSGSCHSSSLSQQLPGWIEATTYITWWPEFEIASSILNLHPQPPSPSPSPTIVSHIILSRYVAERHNKAILIRSIVQCFACMPVLPIPLIGKFQNKHYENC